MAIATDDHQRRQDDQRRHRHDDVDKPLHRLLGSGTSAARLKLDRDRVADIAVGPLEELRQRAERHQRHRQGEHPQTLGD